MSKTLSYKELPKISSLPTPGAGYLGVTVCLTTDGKPYYCDGTTWVDLSATGAGGGGLTATAIKTAAYTAVANDLVRVNSASSSFTITLPASPSDKDRVGIFDVTNSCATNPVLVDPSGSDTVEGDATGLSVDIDGAYVVLSYVSSTTNWKLEESYASPAPVDNTLHPFLLMGA